jgi:D-hydroxyproline dehydrogenase
LSRITIIGGGVVGLSCASALAHAGHEVIVLEPDAKRDAASWGNAGHIATEQVAPLASVASLRSAWRRRFAAGGALDLPVRDLRAWLPFALRFAGAARPGRFSAGSDALRSLLADALPAWQRAPWAAGLVKTEGHLVVWGGAAKAAAGKAAWQAADIGTAAVADAEDQDLAQLRAVTDAPIAGGLRFSGTGQVSDLGLLAAALERDVIERGGQILRKAGALTVEQGKAQVPGHDADLVLVTAGVHSKPLVERAGHRAPIVAERGYHIRAAADEWPADLPPIVFEDRSMIVTRYADTVQAASFVELASPDAPPDPRKWQRLERHVAELGLPMRPPFTRWMGARPTLPDYLPAIGRSRRATNLLYAFGHQHLGLTLAPVTAELVVALAEGSNPNIDLTPFDLERFGGKGGRA